MPPSSKKPSSATKEDKYMVRRSLHYANAEGIVTSASSSIVGSYVTPFALALKATSAQIGMLTAVQELAATLSQIPGAKLTEFYSRKGVWLFARLMSRLVFGIPLVLMSLVMLTPTQSSVYILMAVMALIYFFMGLSTPAWSSLIGDLVSTDIRGRYFGRRNVLLGIAGIAAVVASGYLLSAYGFWLIFLIYMIVGLMSIPFFLKMYEPPRKKIFHYRHRFEFHPLRWTTSLRVNNRLAVFTLYMVLMAFAVAMAGPFYAVYMLRNLSINYTTFALLIMLTVLARIVSVRYWGRLNDKYGSRMIFLVCGTLAIFTPFLWMFVQGAAMVAAVNIFDGLVWAGFDLLAFNYLLDITPGDRRPQYVANFNFFVGLGTVCGALVGGLLSAFFEHVVLFAFSGLQLVFLVSFLIRIGALSILPHVSVPDVLNSKVMPARYVFWQAVAVEPIKGIRGAIHYTFHYPYEIEKEFKKNMRKLEYKVKMISI